MSKDYVLETKDNEKIRITTYGEINKETKNCILVVHGFKGFKNWGFFPYTAKFFEDNGYFVITFNFSLNGVGENQLEFTELDKFARNSYSREIEELTFIVDAYENGFFGNMSTENKLYFLGHSRGGAVSILTASKLQKVDAVATWSTVARLDRYSDRQKEEWKRKGYLEFENARTKQMMKLNYSFLEDIEKNLETSLNIQNGIENLNKPLFLAHGDQDLTVPVAEAEMLYEWSDKSNTELFIVHNTGHTFNIQHPFAGTNEKFEKVLNQTLNFFNQN